MNWVYSEIVGVLSFLLPGFVAAAIFYSLTSDPWRKSWELLLSVLVAVALGLLTAYFLNWDTLHRLLRRLGVTRETSYASEWYSAFSRHCDCYVTLHLKGERRLFGWPEEWPSRPDEGHFRIAEAEWLTDEKRIPATGVLAILIPVDQVEMVEFVSEAQTEPRS